MAKWKLGVGIPLSNHTFRFGTRIYAELSADLTSGNSLSYTNDYGSDKGYPNKLSKFLAAGDKILVGPSTYSNNEGLTQVLTVTSVDSVNIYFSETLIGSFASGDPITGIGTKMAGGWEMSKTAVITPLRITDTVSSLGGPKKGVDDLYRMAFEISNSQSFEYGIWSDIDTDFFIKDIYYRFGFYYQFYQSLENEGRLKSYVKDNSGVWGSIFEVAVGPVTSWTSFDSSAILAPSSTSDWQLLISVDNLISQSVAAYIDNIYLEHAKFTSGENKGVYTFTDYPSYGSRKYNYTGRASGTRLANNDLIIAQRMNSGSKLKGLVVSAEFKDANKSLRDNLEILLDWQDRGYPLVLHHDIPGIANNLYGYLTVNDSVMSSWSNEICSFSITFEEK